MNLLRFLRIFFLNHWISMNISENVELGCHIRMLVDTNVFAHNPFGYDVASLALLKNTEKTAFHCY